MFPNFLIKAKSNITCVIIVFNYFFKFNTCMIFYLIQDGIDGTNKNKFFFNIIISETVRILSNYFLLFLSKKATYIK